MSALQTVASVARRSVPAPAVPALVRIRTRHYVAWTNWRGEVRLPNPPHTR